MSESKAETIFDRPEANTSIGENTGIPIGTVLAWPHNNIPENFLECNGQLIDEALYPKLKVMMSHVPDYRGKFLEGSEVSGKIKEAGLPNIVGSGLHVPYGTMQNLKGVFISGGFVNGTGNTYSGYGSMWINFDASKSNSIYGNSATVQPPAMTVKYIIRAK